MVLADCLNPSLFTNTAISNPTISSAVNWLKVPLFTANTINQLSLIQASSALLPPLF